MSKELFSKEIDMSFLKKNVDRSGNYSHYKKICKEIASQEKVLVSCPICDTFNKPRNIFISVYGLEYIKCSKCSHVYQDYLPTEEQQYLNSTKVSKRMSKQLYEDPSKSLYRLNEVVLPKIKFAIQEFPKNYNGKWLDVGCGTGELIKAVNDLGWYAAGIDNNKSSIDFAKEKYKLDITYGDVEKTNESFFKEFDVISIFLLFEHLREPKSFFNNIAKGSKKGALIITEVNNSNSFSSLVQKRFSKKIDRHLLPCSHTNMFTPDSINYFFNLFGFEMISEWWFGQDFYELLNALKEEEEFENLINSLIKHSNEFQKVIDRKKASDRTIYIFKKK